MMAERGVVLAPPTILRSLGAALRAGIRDALEPVYAAG